MRKKPVHSWLQLFIGLFCSVLTIGAMLFVFLCLRTGTVSGNTFEQDMPDKLLYYSIYQDLAPENIQCGDYVLYCREYKTDLNKLKVGLLPDFGFLYCIK